MSNGTTANVRDVTVRGDTIELSQLLKFGGLAATGGEAKAHISSGKVLLNGVPETQKGKKLHAGDRVSFDGKTLVVRKA